MSSPSNYYSTVAELEYVKARAFLYLMSAECPSINTPLASSLFDVVSDMTDDEAESVIKSFEATQ